MRRPHRAHKYRCLLAVSTSSMCSSIPFLSGPLLKIRHHSLERAPNGRRGGWAVGGAAWTGAGMPEAAAASTTTRLPFKGLGPTSKISTVVTASASRVLGHRAQKLLKYDFAETHLQQLGLLGDAHSSGQIHLYSTQILPLWSHLTKACVAGVSACLEHGP